MTATTAVLFKDLQKLVLSAQQKQQAKAHNALYDRLYNKPFWIWDKEEHRQEVKEQMAIAALTTSLVCLRRMEMISRSMITRN